MIEKPFNMENFYLDFHDKKVDVCYDKCYTTTYTKDNNILTIDDFDYFSVDILNSNEIQKKNIFTYYFELISNFVNYLCIK